MKPGDSVIAKVFGGNEVQLTVVEVTDNTVVVCTQEEWEASRREMRIPDGVGFSDSDVRLLSA